MAVRSLTEDQWRDEARAHARRAEQWTAPHLDRRRLGIKHPVMDFLFEYYPYSPGRLRTWHPGMYVELQGPWSPPSNANAYVDTADGWIADPRTADRQRLELALRILQGTADRPAQHSCFGMHEWAMVYRADPEEIRHRRQPLRLDIDAISRTVDEIGLRCTHIDAFRFFTAEAIPLNATTPTRTSQPDEEQPGCLHANMDLFKYAMWFQPYVPGQLVLDCFELSVHAREIDMRASPYDVSDLGYPPIRLETPAGRQEYVGAQRDLADAASTLRARLVRELSALADIGAPV